MANSLNVTITLDSSQYVNYLQQIVDSADFKTEVNERYAEEVYAWIPYDTGHLANDTIIDETGVLYEVDYARKNYYGDDIRHKTDKHPLATAHWDDVAMQTQLEPFKEEIKEILVGKANNG